MSFLCLLVSLRCYFFRFVVLSVLNFAHERLENFDSISSEFNFATLYYIIGFAVATNSRQMDVFFFYVAILWNLRRRRHRAYSLTLTHTLRQFITLENKRVDDFPEIASLLTRANPCVTSVRIIYARSS